MDEDTLSADEDVHLWMRFIHRWCATESLDLVVKAGGGGCRHSHGGNEDCEGIDELHIG